MKSLETIVRYEAVMHWRRRAIVFLLLLFLVGLIGFSIFTKDQISRPPMRVTYTENEVIETPLPPDESMADFARRFPGTAPEWITTVSFDQYMSDRTVLLLLGVALLPLLIGIPPIFAETIPLDRQHKVRELMETKPLTKTTYLSGKVFGLWGSLIIGLLICAVIYGVAARLLFGAFDPMLYTAFWLLVMFPAALLVAAFSVLLASGIGSRRWAALVGALLVPLSLILYAVIYMTIVMSGMGMSPAMPLGAAATYGEVAGDLLADCLRGLSPFVLGLPVAWALAWTWTKWNDRRSLPLAFSNS